MDIPFDQLALTTDVTLRELANKANIKINYIGFAEDLLRERKAMPLGFSIFNLGDEKMGGTHWTIAYKGYTNNVKKNEFPRKGTYVCYFDSFGVGPEDAILKDVANDEGNLVYNMKQVQRTDGYYCGLWCLLWAMHFDYEDPLGSMKSFVDQFKKINV